MVGEISIVEFIRYLIYFMRWVMRCAAGAGALDFKLKFGIDLSGERIIGFSPLSTP